MYLTPRAPRETGRDYALRTLKDNIIRLELAPGTMVSENELSADLGLSRTPVREALIDLAKVGIVDIYPQRGSAISLIDYDLVEESRFMRLVLEQAVVRLACQMATEHDLQRLEESIQLYQFYFRSRRADSDLLLDTDNSFHRILFQIAQKERVFAYSRNMAIHFDRVRRLSLLAVENPMVVEDHTAILEAIRRKDPDEAAAMVDKHLGRAKIDKQAISEKYPDYIKT